MVFSLQLGHSYLTGIFIITLAAGSLPTGTTSKHLCIWLHMPAHVRCILMNIYISYADSALMVFLTKNPPWV